jgi:prevent-host-death family protein
VTGLWYNRRMESRVVSATEFRAKCLSLLDEVERRGGAITVTRRGRPIAVLGSVKKSAWKSPRNTWAARGRIAGDIVNTNMSGRWEALRGK